MKRIMTTALLSTALLAAPVAQAASNQDRAMATGAVVGATTGAVIGSGHQRAIEGALVGAVFGTVAGAMIASANEPIYVAHERHYQPRVRHYQPPVRKVVYVRPVHRQSERHAAPRSYGHRYGDRD